MFRPYRKIRPTTLKGLLAQGKKEKVRCDGDMTEKARIDPSVEGEGTAGREKGAGQGSIHSRRGGVRAGQAQAPFRGWVSGAGGRKQGGGAGPGGAALRTAWEEKSSQTALSTSTHPLLVKCPRVGLAGVGFPFRSLVNGMNSRQII